MTQYNFEGDIDNITERQLEFINDVIQKQGYKNSKATFEVVGKAGDNYIANVKRIIVSGDNGTMSMVAKIAPANEILRMTMKTDLMFKNEHFMYTEVLPKLVSLQKAEEVPENEQLRFAKCYGSFTEAPNEVILLEDLKELDFVMLDRFQSLSNECVKSYLKNFALLHSLSYVLKHKEPETYNDYKDNLYDMWGNMGNAEEMKIHFQNVEARCIAVLDDPLHKNICKNKIIDIFEKAIKMSKYEDGSRHSVIQQGDAWTNNIMFKFENGVLQQSIMIDYQLSKNSNPVRDIFYMIFNCTDHECRSKHLYDWIDYYHSELDKSLANFGLKANYVYPRDQLDADMKSYGSLLFGLSVLFASVLTMKSEDAGKLKEAMANVDVNEMMDHMKGNAMDEETNKLLKKRIVDLIDSYKQFGLM